MTRKGKLIYESFVKAPNKYSVGPRWIDWLFALAFFGIPIYFIWVLLSSENDLVVTVLSIFMIVLMGSFAIFFTHNKLTEHIVNPNPSLYENGILLSPTSGPFMFDVKPFIHKDKIKKIIINPTDDWFDKKAEEEMKIMIEDGITEEEEEWLSINELKNLYRNCLTICYYDKKNNYQELVLDNKDFDNLKKFIKAIKDMGIKIE